MFYDVDGWVVKMMISVVGCEVKYDYKWVMSMGLVEVVIVGGWICMMINVNGMIMVDEND